MKAASIRIVLTVAISRRWHLNQVDISNTFLHRGLDIRIIISQTVGFVDSSRPDHVCLLDKALYGLKQAPRMWFHRLKDFFRKLGFRNRSCDPSLIIYTGNNVQIFLFVYVDDIVVTRSDDDKVQQVINKLGSEFTTSYWETSPSFLTSRLAYFHWIASRSIAVSL